MEAWNRIAFLTIHNFAHRGLFWDSLIVFFARHLLFFLIAGVFVFILTRPHKRMRWFVFLELALGIILARGILTELIQYLYVHPRPYLAFSFLPLVVESGNSFPSGHATFIFAIAGAMWAYDKRWGFVYLAAGLLMCMARILAGVHWPLDIIGGIVIGLLSAWITHTLLLPMKESIKEKNEQKTA